MLPSSAITKEDGEQSIYGDKTPQTQPRSPQGSVKDVQSFDHTVANLPGNLGVYAVVNVEDGGAVFLPVNTSDDYQLCFSNSRKKEYVYSHSKRYSMFVSWAMIHFVSLCFQWLRMYSSSVHYFQSR